MLINPTTKNTTPVTRKMARGIMTPMRRARNELSVSSRTIKHVAVSSSPETTLAAIRLMVIKRGSTQAMIWKNRARRPTDSLLHLKTDVRNQEKERMSHQRNAATIL